MAIFHDLQIAKFGRHIHGTSHAQHPMKSTYELGADIRNGMGCAEVTENVRLPPGSILRYKQEPP